LEVEVKKAVEKTVKRILIIQRENIGDLVCATPLMRTVRQQFPDAYIAVYVNSYNAPVLVGNDDLNDVYFYAKAKHLAVGQSLIDALFKRISTIWKLATKRFDTVILAEPMYSRGLVRFAAWLTFGVRNKQIIGFASAAGEHTGLHQHFPQNDSLCTAEFMHGLHLGLHAALNGTQVGAQVAAPPCRVVASSVPQKIGNATRVALHISARKPSQRWSADNFIAVAKQLNAATNIEFLLFWSPGTADNPRHPGDDEKATHILTSLANTSPSMRIKPIATAVLRDLIDQLAAADIVICADGGAMHIAAGLGKPIVCLFGKSDAKRWRPWGVPYQLLQKPSLDVADITVAEVVAAFALLTTMPHQA
jgi:heptosyltransferase III